MVAARDERAESLQVGEIVVARPWAYGGSAIGTSMKCTVQALP